ncbi:hypothetical protein AMAG_08216 [Allomyces macrogynus ATCC 38327]|uniref:NmrA-like domain-containing protein n=1 Tax=Allomyces macrogynus (strain ATCC 38327) TaxID=578462 RepID=A0A0L0SKZ8_ALLM3|nr:hypothetical protein AMAG_08216 [Allomyces macrogynus ATCC 38327]|eukprot:KNE63050.1 hypothetical protein AMAG_08216 [Allomyces macrogynus ATCC 38327]
MDFAKSLFRSTATSTTATMSSSSTASTATTKHVVCVTEADSIPGFYAARACLISRDWAKVVCQVNDDKDERAKMLAREGAHLIKMSLDNADHIKKHLLCNIDAMVMVPPRGFDAVKKVKCVMDAIEELKMPIMMPEPETAVRGELKLRALVLSSCILAGFHMEQPGTPGSAAASAASSASSASSPAPTRGPHDKNVMKLWEQIEREVHHRCKHATLCRLGFPMQAMFALSEVMMNKGIMPLNFGEGDFAPVNLKDAFHGITMIACELLNKAKQPAMPMFKQAAGKQQPARPMPTHHGQVYTLTGMQLVNAQKLAQTASQALDAPMPYRAVDDHEMRRILDASSGLTMYEIEEFMASARVIRAGKMGIRSPDLERLIKRAPTTVDKFFAENKNMFKPRGGRVVAAALLDYF